MRSEGLLSETLDGGPAVTSLSPEQTEASWTSSSNQRREGSPQIHSHGKYSVIMAFSHYNVKQGAGELHHPNKRAPLGAQWQRIYLPVWETQETQVQSLGWEDPLEKEKATHSSILVWEIPWTEEPGGLQSMGLQKNWTQQLSTHAHTQINTGLTYVSNG